MNVNRVDRDMGEDASRRLLASICWKDGEIYCPECGSKRAYRQRDGRYRCRECDYRYHDMTGRWLNACTLPAATWLGVVRGFAEERTAAEAARELGVSNNTLNRALYVLRLSIAARAGDGGLLFDPASPYHFAGNGRSRLLLPRGESPVFGIALEGESCCVRLIPELSAETVYFLNLACSCRANLVRTESYRGYDALLFSPRSYARPAPDCCRDKRSRLSTHPFFAYCDQILDQYCGVSCKYYPLYLKEVEFRYNHRGRDMVPVLTEYLCDFTPKVA